MSRSFLRKPWLPLAPASLLALAACGSGTVTLGEEPDDTDPSSDCPTVVVSTDVITFEDGRFETPRVSTVEIDNRCSGAGTLIVQTPTLSGDADAFELASGPWQVEPGARLSLYVNFLPSEYRDYAGQLTFETNDPERPALVVDLQGTVAADQDDDGFDAAEVGGEDCDDSDILVFPGAGEARDGVDNDCDGMIDEDYLRPGDVVVQEIFTLPSSRPAERLWFEVRNTTDAVLDIGGFTLQAGETTFTVDGRVPIEPGRAVVLARSLDADLLGIPRTPEGLLTGGGQVTLVGDWTVSLRAGAAVVYELQGASFPRVQEGRSLQLDASISDPFVATRGDRWCLGDEAFSGTGELGTPGADNTLCGQIDHDGDGVVLDRDCDDTDPRLYPGADEVLDGQDNDCDGSVDQLDVPDDASGEITGFDWTRFYAMGHGDYDDDGDLEVVAVDVSSRRRKMFEATGLAGRSTTFTALREDDMSFSSVFASYVVPDAEDVDGDGTDDVVMSMAGYSSTGIFLGVDTRGRLDADDITLRSSNSFEGRDPSSVTVLDADGDGAFEVLAGLSDAESRLGRVYWVDLDGLSGDLVADDVADRAWGGTISLGSVGGAVGSGDLDDDGYDDLVVRNTDRWSRDRLRAWVVPGAARVVASGDIDDAAGSELEVGGRSNTSYPVMRQEVGDVDDDGNADLVLSSSTQVSIWLDAGDLLTGTREADVRLDAGGSSMLCDVSLADIGADGDMEVFVGWTDAPFSGTFQVGLFNAEDLLSDTSLDLEDDASGRIRGVDAGDHLGCGLLSVDAGGSSADDLFVAAPQRRVGGSVSSTIWYFESQ